MFHSRQNIPTSKNYKNYAIIHKESKENKENHNNNLEYQQNKNAKDRSRRNSIVSNQFHSNQFSEQSSFEETLDWQEEVKLHFTHTIKEHYSEDILSFLLEQTYDNIAFLDKH